MIHNHEVPSSILGPATLRNKVFGRLPLLGAFFFFIVGLNFGLKFNSGLNFQK